MARGRRKTLSDTKKEMAAKEEPAEPEAKPEVSDKDNLDEPKQHASKRRGRRRITIDLGD